MEASQTLEIQAMAKPSVILMGSKPGSVAALEVMLELGWDVRRVVVSNSIQHDWIKGPDLGEFAGRQGLSVISQAQLQPADEVDFVISYMFRHRVRKETLRLAKRAPLNFHAGPLPEYGGWAFYSVAIFENSPEYGCTCHYMDEGFDTGPLLEVRRFPIHPLEHTAYSLEQKAQQEMIRLFVKFCTMAENGEPLPRKPQDPSRMRYLTREQFESLKEIPTDADAETGDRIARAFWYPPYECAYVRIGNAKLEVVPAAAKRPLAALMHATDLDDIRSAAQVQMKGNVA
jgi:methionyl-tRNA formyltransferase